MLTSVTINDLSINMVYNLQFFPSSTYKKNIVQTKTTDISEYSIDEIMPYTGTTRDIKKNKYYYPKRVLEYLVPYLVVLMEESVTYNSIYSFGLAKRRRESNILQNKYNGVYRYIETNFEYGSPEGTAERILKDCLENMEDIEIFNDKEETNLVLYVSKIEVLIQEEDNDKEYDINVYKEDVCIVCMENKPDILFCNCGHLIVCDECYHELENAKCPKCRKENDIVRKL